MIVLDANNRWVEPCHLMVTLAVVTVRCNLVDACRHDGHGFDPIGALEICLWPWWSLVWLMSWWWSLDGLVDGDDGDGASCWWCSLEMPCWCLMSSQSSLMHVVGSNAIWCLGAMSLAHDGGVMAAWWVSAMLMMTWYIHVIDVMLWWAYEPW